jgi:hypothetical protein
MHKDDESKRKLVKARHNLQLLILLLFVSLKTVIILEVAFSLEPLPVMEIILTQSSSEV